MRRTKQEAGETRRAIIDSAERVMAEIGYAQATLIKIAETAGVTRGAVHFHFTSKEEILQTILDGNSMDLLFPDFAPFSSGTVIGFERTVVFWFEKLATSESARRRIKLVEQLAFIDEAAKINDLKEETEGQRFRELSRAFEEFSRQGRLAEGWEPRAAAKVLYHFLQAVRRDVASTGGTSSGHTDLIHALCSSMLVGLDK